MRAAWMAAVVVVAGCGPQTVGSRYVGQAMVTPSGGGTLAISDTNALTGLSLVIPPGAVDSDVMVTVEIGDDVVPPASVASTAALFEPSGLVFHKAATMLLPLKSGVDTSHLFIQGVEADNTHFVVHPKPEDISSTRVAFSVLGFTTFQAAIGSACSTDSDCGLNEACVASQCAEVDGGHPCQSDSECGGQAACLDGLCVQLDGGFPDGGEDDGGVDGGHFGCLEDSDCLMGEVCMANVCSAAIDAGPGLDMDGGLPSYLTSAELATFNAGLASCSTTESGTLPNSTEADIRAHLPGIWARCSGSVLPPAMNEVGIEFTAGGRWFLLIDDGTGVHRIDTFNGGGTWSVINNSQTNMYLNGGTSIIPWPAFSASPHKLHMDNEGVYQGVWATSP